MLLLRPKAMLLSLLALLLVGSFAASSAYAEGGPYWHQREEGGKGEGTKIEENAPLEVQGEGGEQKLAGVVAGTNVEINATSQQVKGIYYNNGDQAQAKLDIQYHGPALIKPELKGCEVRIGEQNKIRVYAHQVWKWDGTKAQLEEKPQKKQKPDWIFQAKDLGQGAKEASKDEFTTITLKGAGCGVLAGIFKVTGNLVGQIKPGNIEEFSTTQTTTYREGKPRQHFWNGKAFVPVEETGLVFGGNAATLTGEDKVKIDIQILGKLQEVALFES